MAVTFVNGQLGSFTGTTGIAFSYGGRPPMPIGVYYALGETVTQEMSELESYQYYPDFVAYADLYIDGVLKSTGIWTPVDGQTVTLDGVNNRIDVVSPGGGGVL